MLSVISDTYTDCESALGVSMFLIHCGSSVVCACGLVCGSGIVCGVVCGSGVNICIDDVIDDIDVCVDDAMDAIDVCVDDVIDAIDVCVVFFCLLIKSCKSNILNLILFGILFILYINVNIRSIVLCELAFNN